MLAVVNAMLTFWKPVEGAVLLIVLFCLQVIYDRETSRSRGFGFVTMASQAEAAAAKQTLDGYVSFLLSLYFFRNPWLNDGNCHVFYWRRHSTVKHTKVDMLGLIN